MATEEGVAILPEELAQIVESVFTTMLGLEASQCSAPWYPSGNRLTSAVHLAGEWNGAVLLECDRSQACRFASRFLSAERTDRVDDVVRDVLGELANMIGGNLKCILTHGIRLSMPCVVDGSDYSLRVCGVEVQERLAFQCEEGVFWVTILSAKT
jgi:chemotaxis protein CheX